VKNPILGRDVGRESNALWSMQPQAITFIVHDLATRPTAVRHIQWGKRARRDIRHACLPFTPAPLPTGVARPSHDAIHAHSPAESETVHTAGNMHVKVNLRTPGTGRARGNQRPMPPPHHEPGRSAPGRAQHAPHRIRSRTYRLRRDRETTRAILRYCPRHRSRCERHSPRRRTAIGAPALAVWSVTSAPFRLRGLPAPTATLTGCSTSTRTIWQLSGPQQMVGI